MARSRIAAVLAGVAGVAGLGGAAAGQWYWPPTEGMRVEPTCPGPSSEVRITLAGDWFDSCPPNRGEARVNGTVIDINLWRDPPPTFCLLVITPYARRVDVGRLPAGAYEVWGTYLRLGQPQTPRAFIGRFEVSPACDPCYPDCDTSTGPRVLDIFDFLCFQNRYDAGAPYACDCDTSTGMGVCDVFDFLCFQNAFAAGCP